jgi:hypothetical protein
VRRRHASHITVVLSKAAHSGPSVCLRARAPCPLRVSRSGADRAERAAQAAAGVSVQCELQVLALPSSLGQDRCDTLNLFLRDFAEFMPLLLLVHPSYASKG